jgi:hypothetical protein
MDISNVIKLLGDIFPLFIDWIKWMIKLPDAEFENITKTWPSPTKMKLAWIRAEAKAQSVFFEGENQ